MDQPSASVPSDESPVVGALLGAFQAVDQRGVDSADAARRLVGDELFAIIEDQLSRADAAEADLRRARQVEGITREAWLGNARFLVGDAGPRPVLAPAAQALLLDLVGPVPPGLPSGAAVGRQILDAFRASAAPAAGTDLPASARAALEDLSAPMRQRVDAALTSGFGSAEERGLVTSLAAALVAGQEGAESRSPAAARSAVAAVDIGMRVAKAGLRFERGELPALQVAEDFVADRVASHVAGMAGAMFETGAATAGAALGAAIEAVVPMGGRLRQLGGMIGAAAGKALRPYVERGVEFVVKHFVKDVVPEVKNKAKVVFSRVWTTVFG